MNNIVEDRVNYFFTKTESNKLIKIVNPTDEEIKSYVKSLSTRSFNKILHLNSFIKESRYPNDDMIVITDLTDKIFIFRV